ncbi:MAG: NADH-quinone oxidoreductase subunit J [Gammaproteobacteria bacterium]|nr:NADH-quinone oxidoreductase subunit J [Gammaproteobacteria bacterium]MBL7000483.1 NADH-quinone oxidoreductase subunit J [Gammaproteobacteria bacterium]
MNNIAFNIALPLLAAFLLPVIHNGSAKASRLVGPFVLLAMCWFAAAYFIFIEHPVALALGGFLPPLGISFHLDQLSLLMAVIIPLMLLLLWPYTNREGFREEALLLLLAGASSGMALSGDLFNIYVFYELLSVASFGLAASTHNGAAFAATFRYLVISGLGTVLALTGIGLIYTQTGTLNLAHIGQLAAQLDNNVGLAAFALIVLGIGVKAEIFPVNGWVPEVYATAKPRISALLAGLISKLAVLAIVRLLVVAYADTDALSLLLVLGILGIIWGELSAWRAKDLKRMFAFSSIGQLGMVLVAFSIPGEAGMFAGLAMMLHHLLVKPALFMLTENWSGSISSLTGAARQSPLGAALFILFALSLIGVPPFPGFWAKLIMVTGLVGADDSLYLLALGILLTATVIEANYLIRCAIQLYAPADENSSQSAKHGRLTLSISSALGVVLIISLFSITPLGNKLYQIAAEASNRSLYINTTLSNAQVPALRKIQ